MGEIRTAKLCPKCGYMWFLTKDEIDSEYEFCDDCGTKMINTGESIDEDEINDFGDRDRFGEYVRKKHLFDNPLFDEAAYQKRLKDKEKRWKEIREEAAADREERDHPRCPRCGSTAISANQKGFSPGKAVVGGLIWGEAGLLRGFVGSGQVEITCLNCGHKWKPGQS